MSVLLPDSAALKKLRTSAGSESLLAFAKLYLPHRFRLPWNRMHTELSQDLSKIGDQPIRLVVSAPDGYGKSSFVSFSLIFWVLAYKKRRCIVLGSSTRANVGNCLAEIDSELRKNRLLRRDFPHLREMVRSPGASGSRASPPRMISVQGVAKVTTIGPSNSPNEISFDGLSPDLIVLDEYDNEQHVATIVGEERCRIDKLEQKFRRRILDRNTEATIVVAGPLIQAGGLVDRLLQPKHSGFWTQRFYPAVESYPENFDLWFEWAEFWRHDRAAGEAFFEQNRSELLNGARVLWPKHESFEKLMQKRAEYGWKWFDTFRQGNPPGGTLRNGRSLCISIGEDDTKKTSAFVDDAGYARPISDLSAPPPKVTINIGDEDDCPLGRPLPGAVRDPASGSTF